MAMMERSSQSSFFGRSSLTSTRRRYSTQVSALAEWMRVARDRSCSVRISSVLASAGLHRGRNRSTNNGSTRLCVNSWTSVGYRDVESDGVEIVMLHAEKVSMLNT